jgi:hypothetical protein
MNIRLLGMLSVCMSCAAGAEPEPEPGGEANDEYRAQVELQSRMRERLKLSADEANALDEIEAETLAARRAVLDVVQETRGMTGAERKAEILRREAQTGPEAELLRRSSPNQRLSRLRERLGPERAKQYQAALLAETAASSVKEGAR